LLQRRVLTVTATRQRSWHCCRYDVIGRRKR
jgi:hypothetical protein